MVYASAQSVLTSAFNIIAIAGIGIYRWCDRSIDMDSPNPQEVEQLQDDDDITMAELDEFDARMAEIGLQFIDGEEEVERITDMRNVLPFQCPSERTTAPGLSLNCVCSSIGRGCNGVKLRVMKSAFASRRC